MRLILEIWRYIHAFYFAIMQRCAANKVEAI